MKMLEYVVGECCCCGAPIKWRDRASLHRSGDELVCDGCIENGTYSRCEDCGEYHLTANMTRVVDTGLVCDDCLDSHEYRVCHDCGSYVHRDDAEVIGDEYFCSDCAPQWVECEDCHCAVLESDAYSIEGSDVCENCRYENYAECHNCGELHHTDGLNYDDDDEYYCDSCWEEHINRARVMGYHEFLQRYTPRFAEGERDGSRRRPVRTYGVELEVDCGYFDGNAFSRWVDDDWLVHFERDGSLSRRGVECITMPCSLRFHQKELGWGDLLEMFKSQDFRSHDTDTCGLHVHIGRSGLRPTTITKLDVFINRANAFFGRLARRTTVYSGSYDPDKRASVKKCKRYECDHNGRYQPVNTENSRTVEIRIFRGSLREETVLGSIELVDALIEFLDNLPITRIYDTYDNIVRFLKFVAGNGRYRHLMPMIKRLAGGRGSWAEQLEVCYAEWQRKFNSNSNAETNSAETEE